MMKDHVLDLLPEEIENQIVNNGFKKFRSSQFLNWIYKNQILSLDGMTNLPQQFRNHIQENFNLSVPKIKKTQTSTDVTKKYLLELQDNNLIEMVIIPAVKKNTLCISSQVGCARNCRFCATAALGFTRNLEVNEIVGQVWLAINELGNEKLTNIVFMGMGEPLDNLENVLKAIRILQRNECFGFSPRRITVSTCGIIPGIKKLAESAIKVKLAVSLNAAIQEKREELMPISRNHPLAELKKTLLDFRRDTPFRITFEYVMIKDFNIGKEDVKALLNYLGDISCKLNLIKWNEVKELPYQTPNDREIEGFIRSVSKLNFAVTHRKSRGSDISAACGQLAANC